MSYIYIYINMYIYILYTCIYIYVCDTVLTLRYGTKRYDTLYTVCTYRTICTTCTVWTVQYVQYVLWICTVSTVRIICTVYVQYVCTYVLSNLYLLIGFEDCYGQFRVAAFSQGMTGMDSLAVTYWHNCGPVPAIHYSPAVPLAVASGFPECRIAPRT